MAGHEVQYGKHRTRRSFSRIKEVLDLPNLIEIQTDSFKDFLDNGLREVFEETGIKVKFLKMCFQLVTLQILWNLNLLVTS